MKMRKIREDTPEDIFQRFARALTGSWARASATSVRWRSTRLSAPSRSSYVGLAGRLSRADTPLSSGWVSSWVGGKVGG